MVNDIIIKQIVEQVWSDETIIIGDTVTKEICNGISQDNLEFIEAAGGSDFNAVETVKLIIQGATLVKVCLEIWKIVSKETGQKPAKKDVEKKLNSDERVAKMQEDILKSIPKILSAIEKML